MLTTAWSERMNSYLARVQQTADVAALALTHVDEAATPASTTDSGEQTAPRLAGWMCSVKACIDVRGWASHAGSAAMLHQPPASSDAALVARLRRQGAVMFAQTNMTEFAYGALGVNAHFGTPRSPLYPDGSRVAGGSSAGAAVS